MDGVQGKECGVCAGSGVEDAGLCDEELTIAVLGIEAIDKLEEFEESIFKI